MGIARYGPGKIIIIPQMAPSGAKSRHSAIVVSHSFFRFGIQKWNKSNQVSFSSRSSSYP